MRSLPEGTATVPWYRRSLTRLQRAALLGATLFFGAGVAAAMLTYRAHLGHLTEQHPNASALVKLALNLLQFVCAWFIAGQATRLAPYTGLAMAGCLALATAFGNTTALLTLCLLIAVALAARPRPHRRAFRICIALMACVMTAVRGPHTF
jgi:hypothetical protein